MSLNTKAVIAKLTIKMWQGTKLDREASEEIREAKHAKAGALRLNKTLLPGDPLLKEIKKIVGQTRNFHYDNSLPWDSKGAQLLPSKNYLTHTKEIASLLARFDELADQFCSHEYYVKAKERAAIELGDLFDEDDYPRLSELRPLFFGTLAIEPIPDAGDFRVEMSAEEKQSHQEAWIAKEQRMAREGTKYLYDKMAGMMEKAVERLSDPDNIFRNSLTGNIKDFSEILKELNIEEDIFIDEIQVELASFATADPEEIRKDEDKRKEVSEEATLLLDKIKNQMASFNDQSTK